jgi:hypothetical protein
MKENSSILYASMLLVIALFATSARSQETSWDQSSLPPPKENATSESASALLKPPNTVSPRTTLKSFIENMNRAYSVLMKAHLTN